MWLAGEIQNGATSYVLLKGACFETAPSAPPQHEGVSWDGVLSVIPDRPEA